VCVQDLPNRILQIDLHEVTGPKGLKECFGFNALNMSFTTGINAHKHTRKYSHLTRVYHSNVWVKYDIFF